MALKDVWRAPHWQILLRPWVSFHASFQRWTKGPLRRLTILPYLAVLGPGLIAAAAGDDAGGIATYASAGASYGYDMLWMIVLITVSLIVVQEMCARMGAVTGKGLSELIREQFGPRWTVFAMLLLLIANGVITISEFAGIAASFELFGITRYLTVPIVAVLIWWLITRGSYARIERVFLVMTLTFFAYPISAALAHPDWTRVFQGTVTPTFHLNSGFIFLFIATVGTTITPYMQIYVQSSVVDKGITAREYPYERLDVIVGSIFGDLISFFIIVATAATLYTHHVTINTAGDAALALVPVAGKYAEILFGVGLLGASMLAAGVLPVATAFSITEAFGWEKGLSFNPSEAPAFYYLFTSLIAIGAFVTLIPGVPLIQLLIVVQVINCLLLVPLLVFIVRLASDPEVMGRHRNGLLYNALAWATVIAIGFLSLLYVAINLVGPLVGISLGP
ncbi:MAG TPA: Nramp family divalent metal transporter [Chloroflexota bacterium]|nr:Nramp family divalent metal transporter [Chloroflexota bacterium]